MKLRRTNSVQFLDHPVYANVQKIELIGSLVSPKPTIKHNTSFFSYQEQITKITKRNTNCLAVHPTLAVWPVVIKFNNTIMQQNRIKSLHRNGNP